MSTQKCVQLIRKCVDVMQTTLDELTDLAIDLDGEDEAWIAGIRAELDDYITATKAQYTGKEA